MHFAVPSTLTTNQVQTNFEQKPIQNEFIGNFDLILDGEFGDLFLIGLLDEAAKIALIFVFSPFSLVAVTFLFQCWMDLRKLHNPKYPQQGYLG
jgi:hypothetical protein